MRKDAFILGYGVVGKATAKSLSIPYHIDLQDNNVAPYEAAKLNICFICLPTPTIKRTQSAGIKIIEDYMSSLIASGFKGLFVVRSTVLPGTCRKLAKKYKCRVASCPETLSDNTWEEDAIKPKIIIIGADTKEDQQLLVDMWAHIKCKNRVVTDTVTSETLKYAFNTFFLTKLIWANQMYDACQKSGAKYNIIREALYTHPWGSKHHLKPVHKGGRGGGGKCFPKDIKAFAHYSKLPFFKTVDEINDTYLKASKKI